MPKTYEKDYGPKRVENATYAQARSEVGKYFGELIRKRIWNGSTETNSRPSLPIPSVEVQDYILSFGGNTAVRNFDKFFHNPERTNGIGVAKSWVRGYLAWYFPQNETANHLANRDEMDYQPQFWDIVNEGALIRAKEEYPNFPWTLELVKMAYGPWRHPDIPDRSLTRINMNLQGETIMTWADAQFRQEVFGKSVSCYLPRNCSKSSQVLQIGGELYSDWVEAKDASHGHPMTTVRAAFAAKDGVFATPLRSTSENPNRRAFKVRVGSAMWTIVFNAVNPPYIVTLFKS